MHIPQQLRQANHLLKRFTFYKKKNPTKLLQTEAIDDISFKSFSNVRFQTKCLHLVSTAPLSGIGSMPVVDVIIQVTWPPH